MPQLHNKHLLFFITEDWYFCSYLPLARSAIQSGYKVTLITQVHQYGDKIRAAGIHLIPIQINRSGLNPIHELMLIAKIFKIYVSERPNVVHHVAIKPIIYGTIAARLAGISSIVNAFAGLGFVFSSRNFLALLLKPVVLIVLRLVIKANTQVILQNPDDMQYLCKQLGLSPYQVNLVYGDGVDLSIFTPSPRLPETYNLKQIIILPSRLLWDKGVGDFVQAATILQAQGFATRCVLVGAPDIGNPASISQQQIESWVNAGIIEWWGHCNNMPQVLQQSHIVCLPSYREGLPKSLVEAAACGKPIVTTDTPGCREVVRDGENGLLVPVKDVQALAVALAKLIQDPKLCEVYGKVGRQRAESMFGSDSIIQATLAVYDKAMYNK